MGPRVALQYPASQEFAEAKSHPGVSGLPVGLCRGAETLLVRIEEEEYEEEEEEGRGKVEDKEERIYVSAASCLCRLQQFWLPKTRF